MIDRELLLELTEAFLKATISDISKEIDIDIDAFAPFAEMGVDSFHVLKIVKKLESDFGLLPKTLLFEHFNVNDLALYFIDKHQATLMDKFKRELDQTIASNNISENSTKLIELGVQATADPVDSDSGGKISILANSKVPVLIPEKTAYRDLELSPIIQEIYRRFKNESSVSRGTRNIAPYLFIGSDKRGFFNYSRNGNIILAYAYTGPKDYFPVLAAEILDHCLANKLELNITADIQIEAVGDVAFSATPFGVIQRIVDLKNFSLQGGKMRRLRYQVSKFEKAGDCHTKEYVCGTDSQVDRNIADVIDQWCESRTMVNPLVYIAKEEILAGTLATEHRIFLTYVDNILQNVIIISAMSKELNGYLMDLEFYPEEMPLGGLEFSIIKIIEIILAEGCDTLSLGATLGPKLSSSANADIAVDNILDDLRKQKVFNDEGNLQFKNKFRPQNETIFLCRAVENKNPDSVVDIIMMIADPERLDNLDPDNQCQQGLDKFAMPEGKLERSSNPGSVEQDSLCKQDSLIEQNSLNKQKQVEHNDDLILEDEERSQILSNAGYNPLNLLDENVEIDLKTDSWAQLNTAYIEKQAKYLHSQLQQQTNVDASLKRFFPFAHYVLTASGRTAESAFFKTWENKGTVLQNILFPTTIFNQIDNGFEPKEIPSPELYHLDSEELFKGNLDLDELKISIQADSSSIAFVCIEVSNNAAGGGAVSVGHLKEIKEFLAEYSIPLLIDGTRIIENARLVIENEQGYSENSTIRVVQEILGLADVVIASLAKDFSIDKGGLIATNDENLFHKLQALVDEEGIGLDVIDKKLIGLSLENENQIVSKAIDRMKSVKQIGNALIGNGVPIVTPIGGHCILIDVKRILEFKGFQYPVASFIAWMYLRTGIRAGAHSVGMQNATTVNDLARLAVPIGTTPPEADEIINKMTALFKNRTNITEIHKEMNRPNSNGDIQVSYRLKEIHQIKGLLINKSSDLASNPDKGTHNVESIALNSNISLSGSEPLPAKSRNKKFASKDIAIVGMAGRFPKARNLNEMWENLRQGKDCIEEIPENRLAIRSQNEFTTKYRGGFLQDIDKFDSLFFNISPREAEMLDPQERLFLEVAWEVIEDAGYYPEILAQEDIQRNIGVFVGAVWAMYQMIGAEEKFFGNNINPNSFLWSIANRVSYWMNLSGPSLTLDTACSSSLTALSLACESISNKESSAAIVGGVNLDLHQTKIDINMAGGALSKDGVCRSFGAGANGYVAGEGVGAIFLKPLEQAIQDKDSIYGVIKSIAVNHGGRTSGYTVPNPTAQTNLILSAFEKAQIDARSISYIEAHGTGTELGDPIEITGLTNAFKKNGVSLQSCAIGSIKSNIGHAEAAAGIFGVCKVLLQMKHRQLVPSLHSSRLNDFIDFENSPFYVEQELKQWKAKEVDGVVYPLRAGVSSFGAGGSNAHVIIDNYEPQENSLEVLSRQKQIVSTETDDLIFPLSARNEDQLRETAIRLKMFLESESTDSILDLNNVAFTLQAGRKSFEFRLAIIATRKTELIDMLGKYLEGKKEAQILTGRYNKSQNFTKLFNKVEKEEFIKLISKRRDSLKLAQLWTGGALADWQGRQAAVGKRISLPTYPFADKRHWAIEGNKFASEKPTVTGVSSLVAKHPLIDSNESTFERQIFKKAFNDKEFFIYDHLVSDIPTLPGVAYLELARKAGELAADRKVRKIRNILWVSPITVEDSISTDAIIDLKPNGEIVQFEVYGKNAEGNKQLYSQGKLSYATKQDEEAEPEYIDVDSIRARCSKVTEGKDVYPIFKTFGLNLGPSFQVLQDVFKNENEVLGILKIPESRLHDFEDYVLHPSLIDGSFQAGMGAQIGGVQEQDNPEMFVPYSIGEVEIFHPLPSTCFSYVTKVKEDRKTSSKLSKANVFILDEKGKVLVKIHDSIGVPLADVHEKPVETDTKSDFTKLYYSNTWNKVPFTNEMFLEKPLESILLFDTNDELYNTYLERLNKLGGDAKTVILVKPGKGYQELNKQSFIIDAKSPGDYSRLIESLGKDQIAVERVCFAWPMSTCLIEETSLTESLDTGVYSFLLLSQSLVTQFSNREIQMLYLYLGRKDDPQPHNEAFNGFANTLQIEYPKVSCRTLEIQRDKPSSTQILDVVLAEFCSRTPSEVTVRYENNERYARTLKEFDFDEAENASPGQIPGLRKHGVYLITGGAGGLGLIFAEFLAREYQAKLVLTGRTKLTEEREKELQDLKLDGAEIVYMPADVSMYENVNTLVHQCKSLFGEINGVIHSAGVLRDSYIKNKSIEEMSAVFAPKIQGTVNLDQATKNEELDFFVLFSSLAAIGGNVGQCDYSFANHYMDSFANKRTLLQTKGERSGKTLSLNWSLWADGGMKLDEQTELFFKKNLGIKPISIETGIEAFSKGLASPKSQFVVLEAVQDKIERVWGLKKAESSVASADKETALTASQVQVQAATNDQRPDEQLVKLIQQELSQIVVDFLKLDACDISLDKILLDLGFDSIGLTTYANSINEKYQLDVTPVLFFEYPSIGEIASYLSTEHNEEVLRVHQLSDGQASSNTGNKKAKSEPQESSENIDTKATFAIKKNWRPSDTEQIITGQSVEQSFSAASRFVDMPIAIVGMSGVMPQSENLDEFWENLKNERNMITVIPRDRWNWEDYDGDPLTEVNKSNSKWGGFMKEADKFDPLFFGISPREAELMDPQQRVFLETVWKTIEDSGHKVSDLSGTKTGVYVGVATNDYVDLLSHYQVPVHAYTSTGNSHSILVNRVSFLLNLHGPSAALDTACSSSLIALHRAIESIHTGSSEQAIVGGVQVMTSPAGYIAFGQAGMLSSDGKCKTFDKKANGYVRGEGAGAILIKPLSMAKSDGNHIYAIVKATAENHGGRAAALTAPNPSAQADLLIEAYEKAQVDPARVGYIECHGTGTSLGDPIEIQALKKSFHELYKKYNKVPGDVPHCGLSSVKTNIGHLETAAGISGLLKLLLAIKHQQIPASNHFEEINPYISLKGSPFYIVDKTRRWEAMSDENGNPLPRIAGVSSFGFGGANAHIVLEEYFANETPLTSGASVPQLIVLSAKNSDRLKAYAQQLLVHLEKNDSELIDIAYTLQLGRDAMAERVGFLVNSMEQLTQKLKDYTGGVQKIEGVYQGQVNSNKESINLISQDNDIKDTIVDKLISHNNLGKLLELWVKGFELDWTRLHGEAKLKRISLPTYPFAKERYWFDISDEFDSNKHGKILHPLVHSNTSDLNQQKYSTTFNGEEFFLTDYQKSLNDPNSNQLTKPKVLPEVIYLEMARAALELASPGRPQSACMELSNIVSGFPLLVADFKQVNIALFAKNTRARFSQVEFEIYSFATTSDNSIEKVNHCKGLARFSSKKRPEKIDIRQLKKQMRNGELDLADFDIALNKPDKNYGAAYRGVEAVNLGDNQLLAHLKLPNYLENGFDEYQLHPSLLEIALQSSMGLLSEIQSLQSQLSNSLTIDSLRVFSGCTKSMFAWVRHSTNVQLPDRSASLDIDLCDQAGNVCVQMTGASRQVSTSAMSIARAIGKVNGTLIATSIWKPSGLTNSPEVVNLDTKGAPNSQHHIILCDIPNIEATHFESLIPEVRCLVMSSNLTNIADRFTQYALACFELVQELFKSKGQTKIFMQVVISNKKQHELFAGLSGLIKTAALENPNFVGQVILTQPQITSAELAQQLRNEQARPQDKLIKYVQNDRFVFCWQEKPIDQVEPTKIPEDLSVSNSHCAFKEKGVYLITGGLGGLGVIFAKEILQKTTMSKIILTGRSRLNKKEWKDKKRALFGDLVVQESRLDYRQLELTDLEQVTVFIESMIKNKEQLTGIIHSAGMTSDNFIIKKTSIEFKQVLAPKVNGTVNLDLASKNIDLDFFVLFSSVSSTAGNLGQADYATANGFLDQFANNRNQLVASKHRSGKTLSINWPLWQSGGMTIDKASQEMLLQVTGMRPMQTATGLQAFYHSLASGSTQTLVMEGNLAQVSSFFSCIINNTPTSNTFSNSTQSARLSPSEDENSNGTGQDSTIEKLSRRSEGGARFRNQTESAQNVSNHEIDKLMKLIKADLQEFQEGVN